MRDINHFDKVEANLILNKLIPLDSPHCLIVQRFVIYLIGCTQDYCMTIIDDEVADSSLAFIDSQMVAEQIIKEGKTDTWAVTYMLALFYQVYGRAGWNSNAWRFMGGYLQVMFVITSRMDEHFARIAQLGVRVRMGLKPNNPQSEILDNLIAVHSQNMSLQQVLKYLREYEVATKQGEESGSLANKRLASKIGQIRLAYEVVAEDKIFFSKKRPDSDRKEFSKERFKKSYIDSDGETLRAIKFSAKHQDDNVAHDENIADDDSLILLDNDFEPTREVAKSSELQQWKIKSNYRHARRNQFYFPTNTRQLSLISYQMLFARIWALFLLIDHTRQPVYAVIILALLSGRRIQEIIEELKLEKNQRSWLVYEGKKVTGNYMISNTINVTANRRSHLLEYRQSHDNELRLALPIELQIVIQDKIFVKSDEVSSLLASLKLQLSLPALTNQHIDAGLYTIIKNELNEPLHADIITGIDVKHSSPLYYTSIEAVSLEITYSRAIHLLSEYCEAQSQAMLRQLSIKGVRSNYLKKFIGSDMTLSQITCQRFFAYLAQAVEGFNGRLRRNLNMRQDRYIDQFNAYSIWLWHIIMIQTGIRPVKHAPGVINQFDFKSRLLWVSDKEERNAQECGRLIPLSDFLITAIQNYITYIRKFAALHNVIYPEAVFPIEAILNSRQPLIQIFSKNPKGFLGITPSKVRYQLQDFLSHQDNWLRHQLRSMLTNKVPEYLLCALYGHEHPEQEAMHPMSSISMNEIKSLSIYLDQVAGELKLRQVEVSLYG